MAEAKAKILIVEDDLDIAEMLNAYFRVQGYEVFTVNWGEDGVRAAQTVLPNLVILDIRLPDIDGFEVARRVRSDRRTHEIPIIFLTEKRDRMDRLQGFEVGADDYITKPLSFPELTARVEAALRRAATSAPERARRLRHGDLVVDLDEHRAHVSGDEVSLTPTEFRLLAYLVEHAGQLVTHRQVLGAVWGAGYDRDVHLLRMTIRNLRLKLEAVAPGSSYIATEYGLGYRLTGPATGSASGRT